MKNNRRSTDERVIDLGAMSDRWVEKFADHHDDPVAATLLVMATAKWRGPPFDLLRKRFPHGVSNASDRTLALVNRILSEIARDVATNDADTLQALEEMAESYLGIREESKRILRARAAVGAALTRLREHRTKPRGRIRPRAKFFSCYLRFAHSTTGLEAGITPAL